MSSQNYLTSTINVIKRLRSRKTLNYKNNRRMKHVLHEFSIVITDTFGLYNGGKVILLGWEGCVVSYCCIVGKNTDMLDIWTAQTVETFQLPNSVSTLKSRPALESRENCSFSVFSKVQQSSKQRQTWPERKAGKQTQTHTHIFYSQCRLLAVSQTQCPLVKSKQARGEKKRLMLFCSPLFLLYKSFFQISFSSTAWQ